MPSIASTIDHTLLKPDAREADIEQLCAEAIEHGFHSVCINSPGPRRVRRTIARWIESENRRGHGLSARSDEH